MKKQLYLILLIGMMVTTLSACGKDNQEQEVKRIEASNAAESKEPTERKYEDTNKEPVIAPDRNSKQEVDNTPNAEENTIIERDPTIYGIWSSTDNSNLTIFNSSAGIKFIMYDAPSDNYITGDVTTDNSTYIEMKYLKPVKQVESTEPVEEQPIEDNSDSVNPYGSDEELYAALEAEHEAQYETVKYSIDKNEFNTETSTMYLTITGNGKTLEMSTQITPDTPDYSKEDNELALDMVNTDNNEKEESIEEEVTE